ncbi:MAG: hypothetical protein FJW20_17930 [Acidimicrobiia bacterium]|nr:hypothetical protein [Acidimicrobiia bacterium]
MRFAIVAVLSAFLAPAQEAEIRLVQIATGIGSITDIQHPGDGSGRLFFARQNGLLLVYENGRVLPAPLLDIQSKTRSNGECGLLGVAFPPGFTAKRYFYVNYTDTACRNTFVSRYHLSADANLADPLSEQVIFTQTQPFTNHNAGQLVFGPDGYLYLGLGDGGSARDPLNAGQDRRTFLGKMLRIDTESGAATYRVPSDNPFVNDPRYLPEIWATGLRNPWRYSFDRETGDLWIGDVGQNRAEEIDFQPASSRGGENYGWRLMEGLQCLLAGCDMTGLMLPVLEYDSRAQNDVSVTGGFVYRGRRFPALLGTYIYGDYQSGRIWGLRREGNQFRNRFLLQPNIRISTFGEDEAGEIYVGDHRGGVVYRIEGTQAPAQRPAATAAVNGASFEPGVVAGSPVTVFGTAITTGAGISAATSIPLPRSLAAVRAAVNGSEAPIYAVANANGQEQVNIQIPWEATGPTASIILSFGEQTSPALQVPLLAAHPGIFAFNGGEAIVVRAGDNTLVTAQRPLEAGENVYFYAAGLGAVSNRPATGAAGPSNPLAETLTRPTVTMDGVNCEVQFAGLAPGFVGLYQVNIRVPAGLAPGSRELVLRLGGAASKAARVTLR